MFYSLVVLLIKLCQAYFGGYHIQIICLWGSSNHEPHLIIDFFQQN